MQLKRRPLSELYSFLVSSAKSVSRYELPNLNSFNFLLRELGGEHCNAARCASTTLLLWMTIEVSEELGGILYAPLGR